MTAWIATIIVCAGVNCTPLTWPVSFMSVLHCQRAMMLVSPMIVKQGERVEKIRCRPHAETIG